MAVDTAAKRYSMFGFGWHAKLVMPAPNGVTLAADRAGMLPLYAGLALSLPTIIPGAKHRIVCSRPIWRRKRGQYRPGE